MLANLLRGGFYTAFGRNPVASFDNAVKGLERSELLAKVVADLQSRVTKRDKDGSLALWSTPLGDFWSPDSADSRNVALVLAEQEVESYGEVRTGDYVLDCGANIGAFSVHALKRGAAHVLAFEPAPETRECLRRNTEAFGSRITICPKGLWDQETELTFFKDVRNSGGSSFITQNPGAVESGTLAVTTIQKSVAEYGLARVDFIKMDIEAAEVRALNGAASVISEHHPRIGVAVEHTPDRLANARNVIAAVKRVWADYHVSGDIFYLSRTGELLPEVIRFATP